MLILSSGAAPYRRGGRYEIRSDGLPRDGVKPRPRTALERSVISLSRVGCGGGFRILSSSEFSLCELVSGDRASAPTRLVLVHRSCVSRSRASTARRVYTDPVANTQQLHDWRRSRQLCFADYIYTDHREYGSLFAMDSLTVTRQELTPSSGLRLRIPVGDIIRNHPRSSTRLARTRRERSGKYHKNVTDHSE